MNSWKVLPQLLASWGVILVLTFTGCDRSAPGPGEAGSEGGPEVNEELQGKILVDGSSTVFPISEAAASQFMKQYPNVNIPVGSSGTGAGFRRFLRGETEISDASRPIKPEEFAAAVENGLEFVELPVAYDGLTIVVNPENDFVESITVEELRKIFTVAGSAKKWSDVRAGWPEREIAIFAPGTDSGTFDYFSEVIAGDDGEIRNDISTSEDDNVLVTGVAGSPDAIGFFGVAYFEENRDKLRAVAVVDPETGQAVMPDADKIESGEYAPFSRPLFIYAKSDALRRPDVKRFISFYLDNAPKLATSKGYVSLPAVIYERASENVKARKSGTHYVTAEGEKRQGPVVEVYVDANRVGF